MEDCVLADEAVNFDLLGSLFRIFHTRICLWPSESLATRL
uniref:Uncharacterized protein n=1 Tax=Rhizophora mucronata TaxID=61149 RepID=A0A2P2INE6_RHIMU